MQNIETSRRFLTKSALATRKDGDVELIIRGSRMPFSKGQYEVLLSLGGEEVFSAAGSFSSVRTQMGKQRDIRGDIRLLRKVGEALSDNDAIYSSQLNDAQLMALIALSKGPKNPELLAEAVHMDIGQAEKAISTLIGRGDIQIGTADARSGIRVYTLSVGGRSFIRNIAQEQRFQRIAFIYGIMRSYPDAGYSVRELLRDDELLCLASLKQKPKTLEELSESVPLAGKDIARAISRLISKRLAAFDQGIGRLRTTITGEEYFHLCDKNRLRLVLQQTP